MGVWWGLGSSSSSESLGGGVQHLIGGGLGGGTQSWCRGGVGKGGWQASLGQKGVLTHPFDSGKSKGVVSAVPKLLQWQAALHIVMYMKSTSTYGITFQRGLGNGVQLELYVDADYAHETNDRRPVSGGVVMCIGAWFIVFSLGCKHALRSRLWK